MFTNIENKELKRRIDYTFATHRNGGIDEQELIKEMSFLKSDLSSRVTAAESNLKEKKNPLTARSYNPKFQIGEMQKNRAYQIHKEPIQLVRAEIEKEYAAGNMDFCTTLADLVYQSDRKEGEKVSINKIVHKMKTEKGIFQAEQELREVKNLDSQLDLIIDNAGNPDYIKRVGEQIQYSEIGYTRELDRANQPENRKTDKG